MEVKYRPVNILADVRLKQWLKHYSNWPTFPQVYVNGKFMGGSEMIIDMIESEEFLSLIPQEAIKTNALERIKLALAKSMIVLFLKGTPTNPRDGYQEEVVDLLEKNKVRYTYYDVMSDPDVREILKEYSKITSYPQIFVQGQPMQGGLVYMREEAAKGNFVNLFP